MRTLIVMRHATAVEFHEAPTDYARDLSDIGRLEASNQAIHLSQLAIPDYMIASSALRTSATAAIVASGLKRSITLSLKPELHPANVEGYYGALKEIPEACHCAMIVGHNPSISTLIALLSGNDHGHLPPAGIAMLQVPIDFGWDAIPGSYTLIKQFQGC